MSHFSRPTALADSRKNLINRQPVNHETDHSAPLCQLKKWRKI